MLPRLIVSEQEANTPLPVHASQQHVDKQNTARRRACRRVPVGIFFKKNRICKPGYVSRARLVTCVHHEFNYRSLRSCVQCHAAIKNAGGQEVFKNTSLAALLRLK